MTLEVSVPVCGGVWKANTVSCFHFRPQRCSCTLPTHARGCGAGQAVTLSEKMWDTWPSSSESVGVLTLQHSSPSASYM
eukprot:3228683-Prymnesium_polylepis.1